MDNRLVQGDYAELRRLEAASPKMLYALDAIAGGSSLLHDADALAAAAERAVEAGRGHVLDTCCVTFPNGALTLVLVLAESHLSIHTWPEEDLVAIDLFSCGAIDGERVLQSLTDSLALREVSVSNVPRGLPPRDEGSEAPDGH